MVGFNRRFAPLVERLAGRARAASTISCSRCASTPGRSRTTTGSTIRRTAAAGCSARAATSSTCSRTWPARRAVSAPRGRGAAARPAARVQRQLRGAHPLRERRSGTLVYSGGGDPRLPKERLEVFGGGVCGRARRLPRARALPGGKRRSVEVARRTRATGPRSRASSRPSRGDAEPPPARSYLDSTRLTLALAESLSTGRACRHCAERDRLA